MQEETQTEEEQEEKEQKKALVKAVAIVVFLITMTVIGSISGIGIYIRTLINWFNGLGVWAPVIFILIYVIATVLAIPRGILTVISGSIFGSIYGIIIVNFAATVGAALAFLVSRHLMRKHVNKLLSGDDKFQKLNLLMENHGSLVVAFTRLTPIFPYNLLNYGFGLTRISFHSYVFWSWLCMLPWLIVYVFGGDAIMQTLEQGAPPFPVVAGIIVATAIIFLILMHLRKRLKKTGGQDDGIRTSSS